jgi:hypothetical protein
MPARAVKKARPEHVHEVGQPYPASNADERVIYHGADDTKRMFIHPSEAVEVKQSEHLASLGLNGLGVFARINIPKGAVFGYYAGVSFNALPKHVWENHPLYQNPYNLEVRCLYKRECGRSDHKHDHKLIVCGDPAVTRSEWVTQESPHGATFASFVNAPRVPGFKTEKGVTKMWLVLDAKEKKVLENVDCSFIPGARSSVPAVYAKYRDLRQGEELFWDYGNLYNWSDAVDL